MIGNVDKDSVGLLIWMFKFVYLVNGESDAPAAEEQRAPANGWCDLADVRTWLPGKERSR